MSRMWEDNNNNNSSKVTVTLGRGHGAARVVKRANVVSNNGVSWVPLSGSKRSIRDRLGGDADDGHYHDKRQRGEAFGTSSSNDTHLSKGDLRFKLMQKNMLKQSANDEPQSNLDLREKLSSRNHRPGESSRSMRPPEAAVSSRHPVHQPRDVRIVRYSLAEPRDSSLVRGTTPRTPSGVPRMEPARSYSWTLENLRRRSPERIVHRAARRGLSPERNREDLLGRSAIRTYNDGRSNSSIRQSPSRPVSSHSYLARSSLPAASVKPLASVPARYSQASGLAPKVPSRVNEYPTVDGLLHSLGLEKYVINFKAEEVDMNALRQMGDNDLKELGIPMGPRKKIILAVMARFRRLA